MHDHQSSDNPPDEIRSHVSPEYEQAMLHAGVYFLRHTGMFIIQGYNHKRCCLTNQFYHVAFDTHYLNCDCVHYSTGRECWHTIFAKRNLLPHFGQTVRQFEVVVPIRLPAYARYEHLVSVIDAEKRPVIVHQTSVGKWFCRHHRYKKCQHRSLANEAVYGPSEDGDDDEDKDEAGPSSSEEEEEKSNSDELSFACKSKQRIAVPLWALLPNEAPDETKTSEPDPNVEHRDDASAYPTILCPSDMPCPRCKGKMEKTLFQSYHSSFPSMLFTFHRAVRVSAYYLFCSTCKLDVPYDGGEQGIFNFDNKRFLTHDLLNDFTSSFSHHSSETWSGYVKTVRDRYMVRKSEFPLICDSDFSLIWRCFINLQVDQFSVCTLDANELVGLEIFVFLSVWLRLGTTGRAGRRREYCLSSGLLSPKAVDSDDDDGG
jgi:hypothetical protein